MYLDYCRAKDFCAELKTEIDHVEEKKVEWRNDGLQRLQPSDFPIGQFPGYRDTGSPLVIESRGTGRMTIIGMFREQLDENGKFSSFMKMSLFSKIHPDAWNWIVNYADWTEDDTCTKHTSCSCGIEANSEKDLFNDRYVCLKITKSLPRFN